MSGGAPKYESLNNGILRMLRNSDPAPTHPDVANGGGGGDNGSMETRVKALEETMVTVRDRLTKIETRLEHMPTKAELHKEISDQTWKMVTWMTGIATALIAATYFIAKHAS